MCGILAAFGNNLNINDLQARAKRLTHRGPENFGDLTAQEFYVAHNRLSIIEVSSKSNQPFVDDRYVLVFNGEIYNHHELRKQFLLTKCKTSSDTETLFYLLQEEGAQALKYLRGMFAAVFIDKESGKAIAFRDSLGIKPLFYREIEGQLYFASESKTLVGSAEVVNQNVLFTYLKFENYTGDETFFKNIFNLRAGEIFEFSVKQPLQIKKTFFVYESTENSKTTDLSGLVRKTVETSVDQHLLSDVDIGVYMSGGIDSTLVASLAKKKLPNIFAYTGYFDVGNELYDERKIARSAAEHADIKLHEVKITAKDFVENFSMLNYHLDAPRMGMGSFSQFMVAKEVAKSLKVVLAGHGGDEVFCGYPVHKIAYLKQQGLFENLSILSAKDLPWLVDYEWSRWKSGKVKFAPQLMNAKGSKLDEAFYFEDSSLKNLNSYYQNIYIQGLLDVEDKVSMSHSLETRMPLWTQEILHQLYTVDMKEKMPKGKLKGLLKETFKDVLPTNVLDGPKKGFPTPLRLWFKNELYDFVNDELSDKTNPLYHFVDYNQVMKTLKDHKAKNLPFALDERRAHKIWMFLSLANWFKQYRVSI